jgi:dihydrofolate reductase
MKKIRYQVAMSLDGYIAGPKGEYDWIVQDKEVDADLTQLWTEFDTFLMGRLTFEVAIAAMGLKAFTGNTVVVVSRTLRPEDHPGVTIISELTRDSIKELRAKASKDIWLFGGGQLFRALLEMHEVDTVEVGVIPVLLGEGIPLLPPPKMQTSLKLTGQKIYDSGIVMLTYEVK